MSAMARPLAIVFDWDNTLVDTFPTIHAAMNATLTAMGQANWTLAETHEQARQSLRDHFPVLFGERWQEAREIFYAAFRRVHLEQIAPMDGAGETLRRLHGSGLPLAVVSNKTGQYLRREAVHLGWDRYFTCLVGANDAAKDKPSREPLDRALASIGIAPSKLVWFVGDANIDMECALNTGCLPVLMRARPPEAGEFGDFAPAMHLPHCDALMALVNRL